MWVAQFWLAGATKTDPGACQRVTVRGDRRAGRTGSRRAPGLWRTGGAVSLLERSGPGVLYGSLKAADDYSAGLDLAGNIRCPTLWLLGGRDAMTPARAAKPLADAIPGARVTTLAGCGNMMMAEQPDEVLDALISIL